jgi:hypothetical protein
MVRERVDAEDDEVGRKQEGVFVCFSVVKQNDACNNDEEAKSIYNHFNRC